MKEELRVAKVLVLHWDGKLLPSNQDYSRKDDRIAIVVTGSNTEQLLGAPSLSRGTGKNIAGAFDDTLNDWNLLKHVKALCFDTTSSNTGTKIFILIYLFYINWHFFI